MNTILTFFFLGVATLAHVNGQNAPTVQADGADITIEAGDGGEITLSQPGSPPVRTTVTALLDTIATLSSDMQNLKDELATLKGETMTNVTGLQQSLKEEQAARSGSDSSNLDALEDTKGNLESMIATNKEDVERNSAQITSSIEGLDADLTTLSASFDEFANNAAPTLTTCKPMGEIRNSLLHKSVTTVPHVVGFQVTVPCKPGYFSSGVPSLTCFSSGKYCASAKWPEESCDTDEASKAKCTECNDTQNCNTCDSQGDCTECKSDKMAIYGGFCKEPATSCKALYNSNLIDEGVTDVALQTPKGGKMVKATCVVENGNVHTHVRCDGLTGGRGCRDHISVRADNTCTDAGYFVTPFRNQKHYAAAFKAWGKDLILKYYRTVGGVYHAEIGRNWAKGTYSQCTPFASTSSCANGFQSVDGGAWWITDRKNRAEPSGDYNALEYLESKFQNSLYQDNEIVSDDELAQVGFSRFNDNLAYQVKSGEYYMCGLAEY